MSIIFYDHLVTKHEIHLIIDSASDADNQKNKAKQLVDDVIHQAVVSLILDRLEKKKHGTFLSLLNDRPFDPEIMEYLIEHVGQEIEGDIRREAERIISEIKKDFEE